MWGKKLGIFTASFLLALLSPPLGPLNFLGTSQKKITKRQIGLNQRYPNRERAKIKIQSTAAFKEAENSRGPQANCALCLGAEGGVSRKEERVAL